MILRPNYSEEEVEALVENYLELSSEYRHKQYIQVRLMDIEQTLRKLPQAERTAVLLCGLLEFTTRAAGELVGVSHLKMWRRYTKGMSILLARLNGS